MHHLHVLVHMFLPILAMRFARLVNLAIHLLELFVHFLWFMHLLRFGHLLCLSSGDGQRRRSDERKKSVWFHRCFSSHFEGRLASLED